MTCRRSLIFACTGALLASMAPAQETYTGVDGIRRTTKGKNVETTNEGSRVHVGLVAPKSGEKHRNVIAVPTRASAARQLAGYHTPWPTRLSYAEADAALLGDEALKLSLRREDNARMHAAVQELRTRGIEVPVPLLARGLRFATQPATGEVMVSALQEHSAAAARAALAEYVARGGMFSGDARRALGDQGAALITKASAAEARRNLLLQRAADAQEKRPATLAAITALAEVPGEDVEDLLRQLAVDWSSTVRAQATKALARRAEVLQ